MKSLVGEDVLKIARVGTVWCWEDDPVGSGRGGFDLRSHDFENVSISGRLGKCGLEWVAER